MAPLEKPGWEKFERPPKENRKSLQERLDEKFERVNMDVGKQMAARKNEDGGSQWHFQKKK